MRYSPRAIILAFSPRLAPVPSTYDAHPRVEMTLPQGITVFVDWIFQWRESLQDGVYSIPGLLIITPGKSNARFVGNRPGTEVRWQANRHLWLQADYGIFYVGKFVKERQQGRNMNYWNDARRLQSRGEGRRFANSGPVGRNSGPFWTFSEKKRGCGGSATPCELGR